MAHTRAQSVAQKGRVSSEPKDHGNQHGGIRKPEWPQTARPRKRQDPKRVECVQPRSPSRIKSPHRQELETTSKAGAKRLIDNLGQEPESAQKRPRRSSQHSIVQQSQTKAADSHDNRGAFDPIRFWAREGKWPREYFQPEMEKLLARKKSLSSLSRKRSNSGTSTTPSDQKPRDEKSAPYRDPRYKTLLASKGSFMDESDVGVADESKRKYLSLLNTKQTIPHDTLFQNDVFKQTCRSVEDRNEARVMRDITPLIVPPAEILRIRGAKQLNILIESLNEGWNNSVPLTGSRPQPDYSLGFRREAFSDDQLTKISPFIGDFISGDQSYFMATYYMYFPFLTCEVKCGAAALDVADRQNAHSMTLAVRAVTELFRAVKREDEIHRQILAFSISHDHGSVRIYGHYPVLERKDTKYYRHPIRKFDFTELDGKEKWTAYQFIKNLYELWMPSHFERICSAIDQLPLHLDFDDPSISATGLSQSLQSHHPSLSEADLVPPVVEEDGRSSMAKQQIATPSTSFTDPGTTKKRKGKK